MKQILLIATTLLLLASATFAQENIQVDVTKLDQNQLRVYQELKAMQARQNAVSLDSLTPEKIDKYAQIGKAFGSAFKECWSTVSTDAEKFANSSAGKWAMVMVSWKIMGNDATRIVEKSVQFVVGGSLLFVGVIFFIYLVRKNCVMPPIAVIEKTSFFGGKKKVYQNRLPIHEEYTWGYGLCFLVFVGVCSLIMFVG